MKRVINQKFETKRVSSGQPEIEVFLGDSAPASGGQDMIQLSTISQGLTDTTRVGDKVNLRKLEIRFWLEAGLGSASEPIQPIRIMIFQYKGTNAGETKNTLMGKLFLPDVSAGGGSFVGTLANRNADFMHLFNIIYDNTVVCMSTQTASVPVPINANKMFHKVFYLKNIQKQLQYINTSASVGINQLYIMCWGQSASLTDNPRYAFEYQLSYTDA